MHRPTISAILVSSILCCILFLSIPGLPSQRTFSAKQKNPVANCPIHSSDTQEALATFLWRFEVLRAQAFTTKQAACLQTMASKREFQEIVGTVSALHLSALDLQIQPEALSIDTIHQANDGSFTVVAKMREVRTAQRNGKIAQTSYHDTRTILYRVLQQSHGWIVDDDAMPPPLPLPSSVQGKHLEDLNSVVNRSTALALAGTATGTNLLQLLARIGFAVHPQTLILDFFTDPGTSGDGPSSGLYARNAASDIPSLITIDAALHVYHVLQSRVQVSAELTVLPQRLRYFLADMIQATLAQQQRIGADPAVKDLRHNLLYLAVANELLGGTVPPQTLSSEEAAMVQKEVTAIRNHAAIEISPILGRSVQYTAFTPQEHYAVTMDLTRYKQALLWLQIAAPPLTESASQAQQALWLVLALRERSAYGTLAAHWKQLFISLTTFTGTDTIQTLRTFEQHITAIYGPGPASTTSLDSRRLTQLRKISKEGSLSASLFPKSPLPHTEIIDRDTVSGLNALAAYGSPLAQQLLNSSATSGKTIILPKEEPVTDSTAATTLYRGGLEVLSALTAPISGTVPLFMQGAVGEHARVETALGWWRELHQDIQPLIGFFDRLIPQKKTNAALQPTRPNYVEPELSAWEALARLARQLVQVTKEEQLLDGLPIADAQAIRSAEESYAQLIQQYARIASAELANKKIDVADLPALQDPDMTLGKYMLTVEHRTAALLHTSGSQSAAATTIAQVLDVGEGPPQELWALVPLEGSLHLARGLTYSYYETPASPSTSNKAWQQGAWQHIAQPEWTREYKR